ncbi:MAG: NTP transferase domain-containing protein [Pseudomonadota bacterium]
MTSLAILILAAGASSRMRGADKLLLHVDGLPQLRRIALQAMATGSPVFVTVPFDNPLRAAALQDLAVTIVAVPDSARGLSASLRAGYRAAGESAALMILPADLPELDTADLSTLIAAYEADPAAIHRGSAGSRPGHPVVLPKDLLPALADLSGDQGARGLIEAEADRVKLCPLPGAHAVLDLDTPEDWVAWQNARKTQLTVQDEHPSMADPLAAALRRPADAVIAVITSVIGASYRSPGAMMCLFGDGTSAGGLTNGCIEGDLAQHARTALATGKVIRLRYGAGSPFFDIRLPCGGGLDVALYPRPDRHILADIVQKKARRAAFALRLSADGNLTVQDAQPTGWDGGDFIINQAPALRFLIFGEGPEATVFTRIVHAAGYAHHLVTPSEATLAATLRNGCKATLMTRDHVASLPNGFDTRTAVVTFFHDHHRELPILHAALNSPAFYVGAQGSRRVAANRIEALRSMGTGDTALTRLHGPIGLIPSSRDPRTLAVSVLAEILAIAEGKP